MERLVTLKAHRMAKEIKKEYPNVNYKFQVGLCTKYIKEEVDKIEISRIKDIKFPEDIEYTNKMKLNHIEKHYKILSIFETKDIIGLFARNQFNDPVFTVIDKSDYSSYNLYRNFTEWKLVLKERQRFKNLLNFKIAN